jgi:hypothetical protein
MKEQSPYIAKKAKANPPINRTTYKRLSLGDVQTRNGISETSHKLKKVTPRTLLY